MKKEPTSPLKDTIAEALILLLQKKSLDSISVSEIVEKAGVNRSTYYRHFASKNEVIRHFYAIRLDEYLSTVKEGTSVLAYFTGMFRSFLKYKKELILLDRSMLSFLLLEEMNDRIPQIHGNDDPAISSLYNNYHIGGVFNSFRYWLREDMSSSPEDLAQKCLRFLPNDFSPMLKNDFPLSH